MDFGMDEEIENTRNMLVYMRLGLDGGTGTTLVGLMETGLETDSEETRMGEVGALTPLTT